MRTHVCAYYRGRTVRVPIEDITHFTSGDKYVTAFHPGGSLILSEALHDLEAEFGADFIRVHRSRLVRKCLIKSFERIDNKCSLAHLADGSSVSVGAKSRAQVKAMLAGRENE